MDQVSEGLVLGEATLDDIPRLADLLTLLFTQEADFEPDRYRQEAGLRQIICNPEIGRILILRQGGTVFGMVNILYTISTALGGRVAILEDMVIHPDRRGTGAGSILLKRAVAFAKEQGCLRVTLLTDKINSGAIRFYERHGFTLSEMVPLRLVF